jgi:hypothetical protein
VVKNWDGGRTTTLEQLWKINVGAAFSAPPMTFEVNGKQYAAITTGPSDAAQTPRRTIFTRAHGSAQRDRDVCVWTLNGRIRCF